MKRRAIITGAGIVGLATARALATRGYSVTVIERNARAIGASVRNFGMIWPVGQPDGEMYNRAMLSKKIWKEVCNDAGIWYDEVGSLHVAYSPDEWRVLNELVENYKHRGYNLLDREYTISKSPFVNSAGLIGGMFSTEEMIVDPREAIAGIPAFLNERYGVNFIWGKGVTDIAYPAVYSGKEEFEADIILVCSGADFETLYPELFSELPLTKCKLQMMRLNALKDELRIGPAICGGLSLIHYQSFRAADSLNELRKRYEEEYSAYVKWGIHVMVSQNRTGELTVGDSHEYGDTPDPFDKSYINELILEYLSKFTNFQNCRVIETWNGVYPKLTNGATDIIAEPEQGVTVINGLGGAGMTLSFGLCEQLISKKLDAMVN